MARKSRKGTVAVIASEVDNTCRAAIYVRLSVEDTHTHSSSIETQQMIIARFLEQNPEISVYNTYIDNGATGTNFHRPGFQQMLSDIEAGHANCVIVKDLSRLGRNAIDTGYYIEQYFRIRNIRFIAVNENYDTAAPEDAHSGILIPLRNMINEAYALDIGRKIRAQQRQAMKDGKFVGARTPYGYLKAEDDCHQLVIDPVAAVVVQKMFQWAYEGAGLNTIAVRLNEAGYLPPSYYKKDQGIITHENLLGNGKWQTRTVSKILRSEVYTGDLVQGQTKTVDHTQVKADADEWTIVRGTHEAIISREQFDAVQEILNQAAQRAKEREVNAYTPNILKGKVFCAHCGGSLHRQRNIRKTSDDVYLYYCLTRSRISKGACPGAAIREDVLLDMLADVLIEALDAALGNYTLSLAELPQQAADREALRSKIASRRQEIQRLRGIVRSLYESLVQGILTKDEYFEYKDKYESKIAEIAQEVEQLEAGLRTMDAQMAQYRVLEQDAVSIKADRRLTAALVDRLIERIEVSHDKQINVRFRFQSEFENDAEVLRQCRDM
ncbi:MAG: recombinase family protein [Eubacteriales bacterium]